MAGREGRSRNRNRNHNAPPVQQSPPTSHVVNREASVVGQPGELQIHFGQRRAHQLQGARRQEAGGSRHEPTNACKTPPRQRRALPVVPGERRLQPPPQNNLAPAGRRQCRQCSQRECTFDGGVSAAQPDATAMQAGGAHSGRRAATQAALTSGRAAMSFARQSRDMPLPRQKATAASAEGQGGRGRSAFKLWRQQFTGDAGSAQAAAGCAEGRVSCGWPGWADPLGRPCLRLPASAAVDDINTPALAGQHAEQASTPVPPRLQVRCGGGPSRAPPHHSLSMGRVEGWAKYGSCSSTRFICSVLKPRLCGDRPGRGRQSGVSGRGGRSMLSRASVRGLSGRQGPAQQGGRGPPQPSLCASETVRIPSTSTSGCAGWLAGRPWYHMVPRPVSHLQVLEHGQQAAVDVELQQARHGPDHSRPLRPREVDEVQRRQLQVPAKTTQEEGHRRQGWRLWWRWRCGVCGVAQGGAEGLWVVQGGGSGG